MSVRDVDPVRLYIYGPKDCGEGVYFLVSESDEPLYAHYCSDVQFAAGDLFLNHPERLEELRARFGLFQLLGVRINGR